MARVLLHVRRWLAGALVAIAHAIEPPAPPPRFHITFQDVHAPEIDVVFKELDSKLRARSSGGALY